MTRTVTRLFDNYSDATAAVQELERLGISDDDISLVSSNADSAHDRPGHDAADDAADDAKKGAGTGAALGGIGGLLAGLGLLAIPGLGPVVAAGWLASTALGAAAGAAAGGAAGGLIGALRHAGHSEEEAHVYSEGVRRGGTLVSVRTSDAQEAQVEAVLQRYRSVDAATRGKAYRDSGWTSFDENAPSYTPEQVKRERSLYGNTTAGL